MSKASHARDRAKSSPAALGTIGALAGGTLGMLLGRKAKKGRQSSWEEESHYVPTGGFQSEGGFQREGSYGSQGYTAEPAYTPRTSAPYPDYSTSPEVSTFGAESWSEPYRSPSAEESWQQSAGPRPGQQEEEGSKAERLKEKTAEFKGRSSEMKEKASQKAADLKHRMSEKTGDMKHRMTDKAGGLRHKTEEMRHKMQERSSRQGEGGGASHLKERMPSASDLKQTARKRPMGVILGGMAIGALAASLLPLSRRERKTMHPAKEKARHQLEDQFSSLKHNVEDKLGMGGESHDEEEGGRSSERSSDASRPQQGGSYTSAGTSGTSGPYATASSDEGFSSSERTSREELGLRSNADEPYRQPSLAEQLENKDKIH